MQFRCFLYVMMVFILAIILPGCSNSYSGTSPLADLPEEQETEEIVSAQSDVKPLNITEGIFEKVYGWIDQETLLYSYENNGKYYVYSHNLYSGISKLVFSSDAPIVNILIHKESGNLFIHTSPHSHAAMVYFTDKEGHINFSTHIDSYELAYEWNKTNPSLMLITAFYEDWSYKVHQINVQAQKVTELIGYQPFLKWFNQDHILEQDWKENEAAFFAPIWKKSLSNPTDSSLLQENVYRFDVFSNIIMTIKVPENNTEFFEYNFNDVALETEVANFKLPNITHYSDWLVPFYDFIYEDQRFITFAPKSHGNADRYNEGYRLIQLALTDQTESILFGDLDNKPLSCSPDGVHCLYGYQFEQILNLETGEKVFLVEPEKNNKSEASE
ncbi:hypothetical protein [Lederbergia citrea]|uniref:YqgU-like beta propeller domain-containing protein n=1 Tax=Lederbergia citrea TaxID=2833581 RepID=UPI001BC8DA83|nr:hypothetical protein [Lederbergia citrea]MBS4202907.1 hypothetical protein [Lederbergia citrea]